MMIGVLSLSTRQRPRSARWRGRVLRWAGALVLHLLPLALLALSLPPKPKELGGAFGSAVSVTLVAGLPSRASAAPTARPTSDLSSLQERLAQPNPSPETPLTAPSRAASTRLSDLFDTPNQGAGAASSQGPPRPSLGGDDDPFARASVSYRGDDPLKAAKLEAKVKRCAPFARGLRLLLIINADGGLAARPRALGPTSNKGLAAAVGAIEQCGPFAEAATPGAPRSYEVNL